MYQNHPTNTFRLGRNRLWIMMAMMAFFLAFFKVTSAWEGDMWYFTSFRNVSEWKILYPTCNLESTYANKSLDVNNIPFTLSPIPLPEPKKALEPNRSDPLNKHVLLIFNHPPPPIGKAYSVSYGFQHNKECLVNTIFSPCLVSPSYGLIRGVVLTANRVSILETKQEFTAEKPEQFVTILNAGNKHEKKFHEAIFLGHSSGSDQFRSTHTVNNKSYPMEIYMYFVDEVFEAMHSATILVVLVEEQEKDNHHITPIVNAVSYHLYDNERKFLKKYHNLTQREQMYHHLKESRYSYTNPPDPIKDHNLHELPTSSFIESSATANIDHYQRFQKLNADVKFLLEDLQNVLAELPKFEFFIRRLKAYARPNDILTRILNNTLYTIEKRPDLVLDDTLVHQANEVMVKYLAKLNELSKLRDIINPATKGESDSILKIRTLQDEAEVLRLKLNAETEKAVAPNGGWNLPDGSGSDGFSFNFKLINFVYSHILNIRKVNRTIVAALTEEVSKTGINIDWRTLFDPEVQGGSVYTKVEQEINEIDPNELGHEKTPNDIMRRKLKRTGHLQLGENLGLTEDEYEEYEKMEPESVPIIQKFQVSWLLPQGGGYYFYKGSSPVPPCYPAERVIVFKKPLKMSREQIKTLAVIPTEFNKLRDIRNTLPPLQKLRRPDFPIYFEKRNHQFLRDDGVHKNSIFEFKKRKEESSGLILKYNYKLLSCIQCILILIQVYN